MEKTTRQQRMLLMWLGDNFGKHGHPKRVTAKHLLTGMMGKQFKKLFGTKLGLLRWHKSSRESQFEITERGWEFYQYLDKKFPNRKS